MIVSRGRGYIFVHIPKTGGTALTLALEARALKDDIFIGDTPKARARKGRLGGIRTAGRLWKHATLADSLGLVSAEEMTGLFTLTLVRNPWDRMVSFYHFLRVKSFDHPMVRAAQAHDFHGFLREEATGRLIGDNPCSSYMRRPDGSEGARLYARIEHFAQDIQPFEDHLGFRLTPLARQNASDRPRDWRPAYSADDADLVARLCADDISRFGYRFDP